MDNKVMVNRILLNVKKSLITEDDESTYLTIQRIYSDLFENEKKEHTPKMQIEISSSDLLQVFQK